MAYLNKVFLIGNLTRDPELRVTPKGTAICQFGIAVNRQFKDESGATAIEYGLIAALIAVGIIAAATALGDTISTLFNFISAQMTAAMA